MSTRVSRRDVLKLMSGVAVGTLFTPVPWKLLDDLAIRTQNEGWIAHPRRGKLGFVPTHCSLCPAGCALNLRCVGNVPVSLSAIPTHTMGAGKPCPYGLVLHHFAGHPDRLRGAQVLDAARGGLQAEAQWERQLQRWLKEAMARGGAQSVAVLDPNPGRALSSCYRAFLGSLGGGRYLVPPSQESLLRELSRAAGLPEGTQLAYELSNCRTLLSFSAPVLEGWGTPGRVLPRLRSVESQGASERARLIQASPIPNVSARLADHWYRIRPGSEAAFALGVARVLLDRGWYDSSPASREILTRETELLSLISDTSLDAVSLATGVSQEELERSAWRLSHEGPSLVVQGDPSSGVAADASVSRMVFLLNVLLGATRSQGTLKTKASLPLPHCLRSHGAVAATSLESIPDASLQLLLIDGSRLSSALPMAQIRRKMEPQGRIVALTPYAGKLARACDLVLPTSAPLEGWDEVEAACDLALPRFALARPVFDTKAEYIDPVQLLQRLSPDPKFLSALGPKPSYEKLLRDQSDALYELDEGRVIEPWTEDGKASRASSSSAQWEALLRGAEWYGEGMSWKSMEGPALIGADAAQTLRRSMERARTRALVPARFEQLCVLPLGSGVGSTGEPVPPLLAKLCRESTLLSRAGTIYLNPQTARVMGLRSGQRVQFEGPWGAETARVQLSERVEPSSLVAATSLASGVFGDEVRS
ncbi:MAG TPA: molybdopterin dinucleotide binding domain-containing protein [Candidatus Krumholzibacteria bacterium]|nr:molybdopterin dinucleotide binding domain-containing protein [Candidatus Krumholzibacteria bacterium]